MSIELGEVGPPRWVWRFLAGAAIVAAVAVIATAVVVGVATVRRQDKLASAVTATNMESARRDCVTTISTARRSVFDNVDIYKAIQIEQLSRALLNGQLGIRATPEDVQAFDDNDQLLKAALVEARRLQPASVLDDLIAHGGWVDGVHYDACPK